MSRVILILLCSFAISGCALLKYADGRYRTYAKREAGKAMRQINNPTKEQNGQFFAGASKIDITPSVGTPLGGYSARKGKPSTGVHDELYARALALKDDEDLLVIVSAELIAIDDHLYSAVFDRVKKTEGFASFGREDLMLIATHTHSGPGGIGVRFLEKISTGHYDPEVFELVADRIAESVIKACSTLKPARLASNSGFIKGLNRNRMVEGGPVDTQLKALRIDDTTGNPIAFFVNFSAHPTVLGRTNMYFSGDYPGSLSRFIEERYPGSVSLFSCAAVADIAPDIPPEYKSLKDFEKSDQIGELLYKEVIKIVEGLKTSPNIDLSSIGVNVPLPPARLRLLKFSLPSLLSESFLDRFASFGVMRLGNILLIGVPCDLNVELGDEIKRKIESLGLDGYIVGFANDYIGYVIPEKYYKTDAYEAKMSFNGPKMDLYLKEVVYDLVDSITVKQFYRMDGLSILHLSGSPYEMGFKHGLIMQDEIKGCINDVLGYFRRYIKVPLLNRFIPDIILDTTYNKMKYFIPPEYEQEMKGLSDGSGIPLSEFHRLIALSELTSSCSGFAGWGKATKDGRFYQTRNLDWNIKAGAQRYPVVLVYHPQNKHRFINIGYAGFVGVLSGINDEGIAVAEIGAKTKDADFRGMPFVFLLRNVLEESDDLNEAVDVIRSAKKTAGYNYIIGDSIAGEAVALEVTKELCAIFKDNDPKEASSKYGLPIDDAIFRSDTAFDADIRNLQYASNGDPKKPGLESPVGSSAYDIRYKRQAELIKEYYGAIDERIAIKIAQEVAQGSNIQSIVYAWPGVYIANARDTLQASKTKYQYLNLKELFSQN